MINQIRGLWAQVKYPLGFTKNGLKADTSAVLFGAGNTGIGGNVGGYETTTVVNAGFIKLYLESLAASGTNVGLYIKANKGAGAGMTALKIEVAGGAKALDITGTLAFNGAITDGTLASVDGSGVALSASVSRALGIFADTGSAALPGGSVTRAIEGRYLIGTSPVAANSSQAGVEGHLKFVADSNVGGNQAGIYAHLETSGTLTLTGSVNTVRAAVMAFLDVATGLTIPVGTVISALGTNPITFTGVTRNGRFSLLHVTACTGGTWDAILEVSGDQGIQGSAAGATNDKHMKVYVSGVLYTIPMYTA